MADRTVFDFADGVRVIIERRQSRTRAATVGRWALFCLAWTLATVYLAVSGIGALAVLVGVEGWNWTHASHLLPALWLVFAVGRPRDWGLA